MLGIDPASHVIGLAQVHDGELVWKSTWRRPKGVELHRSLWTFWDFLRHAEELHKEFVRPDLVVVEKVSVSWNVDTIRKIAYFEAMAMFWTAGEWNTQLVQASATTCRSRAGVPRSKAEAFAAVQTMLPDVEWDSVDEADAYVCALAGPKLIGAPVA